MAGLYISQKILHSHGSRLTVESEAGKGSTFSCPGSGNINAVFFLCYNSFYFEILKRKVLKKGGSCRNRSGYQN